MPTQAKPGAAQAKPALPVFRRGAAAEELPEIKVGLPPVAARPQTAKRAADAVDLSGKAKAWFLIGAGGSGKTAMARWLGWTMGTAGRTAVLAALDPQNRSLASWFEQVSQPEGSDGAQTARWLRELLGFLMAERHSAILDFGGGDTALARLVDAAPEIAGALSEAGVEPVACYMLGPRVDDLASLGTLEADGFRPRATLLVLNEGRVDSTMAREEAFAHVTKHSAFRSAVVRGAVPVWMPRLEPEVAQEIEAKRLTFGQARDGQVPEGAEFAPVGGLERSMVGRWLARMEEEFAPVRSWLP